MRGAILISKARAAFPLPIMVRAAVVSCGISTTCPASPPLKKPRRRQHRHPCSPPRWNFCCYRLSIVVLKYFWRYGMAGKGMSGHQTAGKVSMEWFTPLSIIKPLGRFTLDPCASPDRPWDTAEIHYSRGGLERPWRGRVWLNPPYGQEVWAWMKRLADHGNGVALIFARTETIGFHRWVWERATGLKFLKGRIRFHLRDGTPGRTTGGAPSVLIAYGERNYRALEDATEIAGRCVLL